MKKIIQYKNKFGCTTLQLYIDYTKKTYKTGHFKIGADETVKTMKAFWQKVEDLKKCGFNESEVQ